MAASKKIRSSLINSDCRNSISVSAAGVHQDTTKNSISWSSTALEYLDKSHMRICLSSWAVTAIGTRGWVQTAFASMHSSSISTILPKIFDNQVTVVTDEIHFILGSLSTQKQAYGQVFFIPTSLSRHSSLNTRFFQGMFSDRKAKYGWKSGNRSKDRFFSRKGNLSWSMTWQRLYFLSFNSILPSCLKTELKKPVQKNLSLLRARGKNWRGSVSLFFKTGCRGQNIYQ